MAGAGGGGGGGGGASMTAELPWLHARREPFEFGLLPISSLASYENVTSLRVLRSRLLAASEGGGGGAGGGEVGGGEGGGSAEGGEVRVGQSGCEDFGASADSSSSPTSTANPLRITNRVSSAAISSCLKLSDAHARLVVDTLGSVLPDEGGLGDPLACAVVADVEAIGADVDHLLLFLYLQQYSKFPHRPRRGGDVSIAQDVWPSASPFDGIIATSPSSPVQSKSSVGSRHKSPGVSEEEAHRLSFVTKHLANLLALLSDHTEEDGENGRVISGPQFDRLGLVFRIGGVGAGDIRPLSQAPPFFANADPAMPAAPIPIAQVHEWISRHLCLASGQHGRDDGGHLHASAGGLTSSSNNSGDVAMVEALPGTLGHGAAAGAPGFGGGGGGGAGVANGMTTNWQQREWAVEGVTSIDGVAKWSVFKGEHDIVGGSIRVSHCHDSVVYALAPLKYATVCGCTDSIVVLGAVGKVVKVEHCERVQLIVPCGRIRIGNCRECLFYLGTNQSPLVLGNNYKIQIAPYNTFYARLDMHLAAVSVDPSVNKWNEPLLITVAEASDVDVSNEVQADPSTLLLAPERFVPFVVPFRSAGPAYSSSATSSGSVWGNSGMVGGGSGDAHPMITKANPFMLPESYRTSIKQKKEIVENLRQTLKTAVLDDNKRRELMNVIQGHFKEWLITSGNIRQIYDLGNINHRDG